jgi:carboxylesterase type B
MVFGSTEYQQTFYSEMIKERISYPDTAEQKTLAKTMMTAWASFAKDPENGLEKLGWPVYDATSTYFLYSPVAVLSDQFVSQSQHSSSSAEETHRQSHSLILRLSTQVVQ